MECILYVIILNSCHCSLKPQLSQTGFCIFKSIATKPTVSTTSLAFQHHQSERSRCWSGLLVFVSKEKVVLTGERQDRTRRLETTTGSAVVPCWTLWRLLLYLACSEIQEAKLSKCSLCYIWEAFKHNFFKNVFCQIFCCALLRLTNPALCYLPDTMQFIWRLLYFIYYSFSCIWVTFKTFE